MAEQSAVGDPPAPGVARPSRADLWTTAVLAIAAFVVAMHQNAVAVLLTPIQRDLGFSDTAMGVLVGSAFAVVYGVTALPLAHLSDRGNRRNLLAAVLVTISAANGLAGLAAGFLQFLATRVGAAAAVAGQWPPTFSLLADLFPPARRGAAISVVIFGSSMGFGLGAWIVGLLNDRYGWRSTMMLAAAPGLVLALLILFTVREPPRPAAVANGDDAPGLLQGLRQVAAIRTFWPLMGGFVALNIAFSGFLVWAPAFLMRVHGLSTSGMGAAFGLITLAGAISNIVGGPLTDRLAARRQRWRIYYCAASVALAAPLLSAGLLAGPLALTLACIGGFSLLAGGLTTVCATAFIAIAPQPLRGMMMALMNMGAFLVGGGLGPPLFGLLNDRLKPAYGDMALRYGLQLAPAALLLAAALFWLASRTADADATESSAIEA